MVFNYSKISKGYVYHTDKIHYLLKEHSINNKIEYVKCEIKNDDLQQIIQINQQKNYTNKKNLIKNNELILSDTELILSDTKLENNNQIIKP